MNIDWTDLQSKVPCYVLNMDRSKDRWDIVVDRIRNAGFSNIERIRGLDKDTDDLFSVWRDEHGVDARAGAGAGGLRDMDGFRENLGKQACALGHYRIWQKMIRENTPMAVIFEDDVLFHREWAEFAPQLWQHTPRDFHVLYMGSSFDVRAPNPIMQAPCYCTHAMIVTLEGARFMYNLCLHGDPLGTWTIDIMLRRYMERTYDAGMDNASRLRWYVWNGIPWMDPVAMRSPKWQDRLKNSGFVFQDDSMGSFINVNADAM